MCFCQNSTICKSSVAIGQIKELKHDVLMGGTSDQRPREEEVDVMLPLLQRPPRLAALEQQALINYPLSLKYSRVSVLKCTISLTSICYPVHLCAGEG